MTLFDPIPLLVEELALPKAAIHAVVTMLNEGNTIPFIARYRKEATGNLDEVQIRTIQERLAYITELDDRRQAILKSIESQGKLTDLLRSQILVCSSKHVLEDLYLPYKPKRRTRAMIAREKGLQPLADRILLQSLEGNPEAEAVAFISEEKGVATVTDALAGAKDIVAEVVAETASVRAAIRDAFAEQGIVISKVRDEHAGTKTKFDQYYDFKERVATIPSHRYLAIRRGEKEEILDLRIEIPESNSQAIKPLVKHAPRSPFSALLGEAIEDAYVRLLLPSVETDVRVDLKMRSDHAAVDIFAQNLRNLLLASPLGGRPVIGIDPGLRSGCKCAAIDMTGKYLDHITVYPTGSPDAAARELLRFLQKYNPFAVAVGNGTAGRETELFTKKVVAATGHKDTTVVSVSEAGASVYSASDIARDEFPDLDLTIRGAISIARRLQDPLAELVKIDPKAIGVGQYQHDVHQPLLQEKLKDVVESCVNYVGVELNTASVALLSYVAGIGPSLAKKIVAHRDANGPFQSRKDLHDVSGVGSRTFEQAAGFLRVHGSEHPLDSSAVHPERYSLVQQMAEALGVNLKQLIGDQSLIGKIPVQKFVGEGIGEPTLRDIIAELKKPGRDPRAVFEAAQFRDDVQTMQDLKVGMVLEGVVTNVTAFGAFVDIGVHQDGLVHVSQLSDKFIKDPSEVVQTGTRLKVQVQEVDIDRKRISLTAKIGAATGTTPAQAKPQAYAKSPAHAGKAPKQKFSSNPFASL